MTSPSSVAVCSFLFAPSVWSPRTAPSRKDSSVPVSTGPFCFFVDWNAASPNDAFPVVTPIVTVETSLAVRTCTVVYAGNVLRSAFWSIAPAGGSTVPAADDAASFRWFCALFTVLAPAPNFVVAPVCQAWMPLMAGCTTRTV